MSDALDALEAIYFTLQNNLSDMLAACSSQAERDSIMSQYVAARQAYWSCVGRAFHDDDPAVQALVADARDDINKLNEIESSLGDIAKVMNVIEETVSVATALASKVIAV